MKTRVSWKTPGALEAAWAEYHRTRSVEARNAVFELYRPLLCHHARKTYDKLQGTREFGELLSTGALGLMQAIESFDPTRGVVFPTFATRRIRGAMLDAHRDEDWVPRVTRARAKQIRKVADRVGREPTAADVARVLRIPRAKAALVLAEPPARRMESLSGRLPVRCDAPEGRPDARAEREEWWRWLTAGLTRAEKLVVTLYYREGMQLWQCGEAIGLSESRCSQVLASIHARLKPRLIDHGAGDDTFEFREAS